MVTLCTVLYVFDISAHQDNSFPIKTSVNAADNRLTRPAEMFSFHIPQCTIRWIHSLHILSGVPIMVLKRSFCSFSRSITSTSQHPALESNVRSFVFRRPFHSTPRWQVIKPFILADIGEGRVQHAWWQAKGIGI